MDSDLIEMLPHTVTVEPFTGGSDYSGFTYGTSKTYRAYVNSEDTKIYLADGTERISHATVYIGPELKADGLQGAQATGISPRDRITLDDGTTPPILKVNAIPDAEEPQANYVVKVYV